MAAETTPMPADYSTRMRELTKGAVYLVAGIPAGEHSRRWMPEAGNSVLFDILSLRAEELKMGRAHVSNAMNFYNPNKPPSNIEVSIDDRGRTSFDHELSQHVIDIEIGRIYVATTVDAIARSQPSNLTSLDVLSLIGKPDRGFRSEEKSDVQTLRFMSEIHAVQRHRETYPETAERMSEIERTLTERLIKLWKTKTENPLRLGSMRSNQDTGEGMILFASRSKRNSEPPIRILDKYGSVDNGVSQVPITPELEAMIRKPAEHSYEPSDYDFDVVTGEDDVLSIVENPTSRTKYVPDRELARDYPATFFGSDIA